MQSFVSTAAKKNYLNIFQQLQKVSNEIKPNKIWYSKRVFNYR